MGILKRILLVFGLVILVIAAVSIYILARGGAFRTVEPGFAGVCESLPLTASAEDMTVDHERGFLYVSFMDRQAMIAGEDVQGTVMRFDLARRPLVPEDALLDRPAHLRTHGLSLYVAPDGQRYLHVINHPADRGAAPEMVEIFREEQPGLFRHQETVTDPLFSSPNDLAAVGPREFYIANDKAGGTLGASLQQLGIGGSPLTWFDGSEARIVADDIASGGGINISADGRRLYVAETSAQRIRVLERDPATGSVEDVRHIPVPQSPDNIDVAPDGSLTVAGHPNTLKLIQHFISGGEKIAPSQVLRIIPDNPGGAVVDQLFADAGETISASSVGVTAGNRLFVGSITARKLLVCEMR